MRFFGGGAGTWLRPAAALALIGVLTLTPTDNQNITRGICVVCGSSGLSDLLANVLLFVPFGIAMRHRGIRLRQTAITGLCLTLTIELAQVFIPGRDPGLGDLLSNTSGTIAGWAIVTGIDWWRFPTPKRAAWFRVATLSLASIAVFATGLLVHPIQTDTDQYYGEFAQTLDHGQWSGATADSVTLGGFSFPDWDLSETELVKALIESGARLSIRGKAGPEASRPSTLFTIYDHDLEVPIWWVGAHRGDLVLEYHSRAASLRLSSQDVRFPNALRDVSAGSPLNVAVQPAEEGWCFRVNAQYRCGLGLTAGSGWAFLWFSSALPQAARLALNTVWLGLLFLPFGFTAQRRLHIAVGFACVAFILTTTPVTTDLLTTPAVEWVGAISGVVLGQLLRRFAHRFSMQDALALYDSVG